MSDDDVVARAFDELTEGLEGAHSVVGTARAIATGGRLSDAPAPPEGPCDGLDDIQDGDQLAIELERREVTLSALPELVGFVLFTAGGLLSSVALWRMLGGTTVQLDVVPIHSVKLAALGTVF